MADLSGVDTSYIDGVNGFFTTQGGGGTATTTPTISVTAAPFGRIVTTVTNHSSYTNPNYSISVSESGTEIIADSTATHTLDSDSTTISDEIVVTDTNSATGTRTLTLRAQEFGDFVQSAAVTATYNLQHLSARYIRIRGVTSTGADSSNRLAIYELRFFEGTGQSGTKHPSNLTANTSSGDLYHCTAGHVYSSSYPIWQAFDGSTSIFSMWWALGTNATNNWIQVYFDPTANSNQFATPPTIKSMHIKLNNQSQADYIAVQTSSDGSTFTTEAILPTPNNDTTAAFYFG